MTDLPHEDPGSVAAEEEPAIRSPLLKKSEDASEEEAFMITTGSKKLSKRIKAIDDDEPLIDTTAALPKRSKKTERATKRLMKKQQRLATRRGPATFSDLPPELLEDILSYLRASDIIQLLTVNRSMHSFITTNEAAIARSVIKRRYAALSKCFPLPRPFSSVPSDTRPALLSDSWQDRLQIHKRPYQHVQPIDPLKICTCMTCNLAWNNMNMIVDLAHWQPNLSSRTPIPMIPRGRQPEWNTRILAANAAKVELAMRRPIFYTLILQHHLETTVRTLLRTLRGQKTVHPKRVFHLSRPEAEAGIETDAFLERQGPECHEFPFHRDNYYNLNAYVPNRKWSSTEGKWLYFDAGVMHARDLTWVRERFVPDMPTEKGDEDGRRGKGGGAEGKAKVDEDEKGLDGFAAQFQAQATLGAEVGTS